MKSRKLKEILRHTLSEEQLKVLVRGYDVVGDICIIIIPDDLIHLKKEIAAAILKTAPHIRLVARRADTYTGEYRTLALEKIGGEGDFETLHKEFGVKLHLNPEKVYFSPRSSTERYRISQKVVAGERVLVMFSGIAPLVLMIAKHSMAREIVGIENNPVAHNFGLQNIAANRKLKNILLIHGDVTNIVPGLAGSFDRIAMPLPASAVDYLRLALGALKNQGTLHFYSFRKKKEFSLAVAELQTKCQEMGREIIETAVTQCGHVSPGKYRICIDARVS